MNRALNVAGHLHALTQMGPVGANRVGNAKEREQTQPRFQGSKTTHFCPSAVVKLPKLIENVSHSIQKYFLAMLTLFPMYERLQ